MILSLLLPAFAAPNCALPMRGQLALDASLAGAGGVAFVTSYLLPQKEGSPWVLEIDRSVPTHGNETAAVASDVGLWTLLGAAGVSGLGLSAFCFAQERDAGTLLPTLELTEMLLLSQGPNRLVKRTVGRPRPYTQGDGFTGEEDDYQSFYSGHATSSAASATFLAGLWARSLTDRRWVWVSAQLLAGTAGGLGVGVLRVEGARHYWSDVLTGTGAGILAGFLPFLPEYLPHRGVSLRLEPIPDGMQVSGRF